MLTVTWFTHMLTVTCFTHNASVILSHTSEQFKLKKIIKSLLLHEIRRCEMDNKGGLKCKVIPSKSLEASARLRSNTGLHAGRTWEDANPRPCARLSAPVKRPRSVSTGGKPSTPLGCW